MSDCTAAENGWSECAIDGDIQGADYGTPDTRFQVRAERAAQGPGRVYTIRYRATDRTGNAADAVAQVTVPRVS